MTYIPYIFGDILVTVDLKDFFCLVHKEDYMEEIKISLNTACADLEGVRGSRPFLLQNCNFFKFAL